ncbi:MAG: 3-hydroxyacyl-CoA dehydrogenase NAD-binding domain-containing protein [Candidatus Cloacimonetes bacterium]|nr:3-hydroxyacyl-CoA dehydrogenase NAD-binding domain-containing protein [Candidatus Cloacimonadota bacterium]
MKIGIIGAGTMGRGIAIAFAQKEEHTVALCDINIEVTNQSKERLQKELEKLTAKNIVNPDLLQPTLDRITPNTKEGVGDCDLVIEAVQENLQIKKELFTFLQTVCKKETIFATNTSSLSIAAISEGLDRSVIGLHFFNPVPMMKLVEIVTTEKNTPQLINQMKALLITLGKSPVMSKDHPGFIVNRILIPMINEAIGVFANSTATAEDIDQAMKLGANHPIGPLALGDMIGLDVCLAIMEVLHAETKNDKYKPHELLHKMVTEGKLGRKSAQGFFPYNR